MSWRWDRRTKPSFPFISTECLPEEPGARGPAAGEPPPARPMSCASRGPSTRPSGGAIGRRVTGASPGDDSGRGVSPQDWNLGSAGDRPMRGAHERRTTISGEFGWTRVILTDANQQRTEAHIASVLDFGNRVRTRPAPSARAPRAGRTQAGKPGCRAQEPLPSGRGMGSLYGFVAGRAAFSVRAL